MCIGRPSIPPPQRFQASKEPVYRDSESAGRSRRGRRGTILTGGSGVVETNTTKKKTLLGQ